MLIAHRAGNLATVAMVTGALITGFTVLSAFTACRVCLSEQFPTALRGRGQPFGESTGRLFAGVLAPFLMEPHTGSATIFSARSSPSWRSAHLYRCSLAKKPSASWKPSARRFRRWPESGART
jgi:hypothetical protein